MKIRVVSLISMVLLAGVCRGGDGSGQKAVELSPVKQRDAILLASLSSVSREESSSLSLVGGKAPRRKKYSNVFRQDPLGKKTNSLQKKSDIIDLTKENAEKTKEEFFVGFSKGVAVRLLDGTVVRFEGTEPRSGSCLEYMSRNSGFNAGKPKEMFWAQKNIYKRVARFTIWGKGCFENQGAVQGDKGKGKGKGKAKSRKKRSASL